MNSVLKELLDLPMKTGLDIIDMDHKLLRLSSPIISPIITHIFNLSLAQGMLPTDWKIAKVTPIFKGKGSNFDPSNYRPISVIPILAKILEKCVKSQLVHYFTSNDFLCKEQFAFLKNHSTATALHSQIDNWLEHINPLIVSANSPPI